MTGLSLLELLWWESIYRERNEEMLEPVRRKLAEFAEEIRKTEKVQTGFRQKYALSAIGNGLVRVKMELSFEICNLGQASVPVRPRMDLEYAEAPAFEACRVVINAGNEQWKIGADLLVECDRPGIVRGQWVAGLLMAGERASVLWRWSVTKKLEDRDCISFGNVLIGPVVVEFEPTPDFVFSAESLNPYQHIDNGWEWGGCFLPEQHVNIVWRPSDVVRAVESKAESV